MLLLGLLFYFASIIFGAALVNFFLGRVVRGIIPKYAFAFPIGFALAAYLVFALDALNRGFSGWLVLAASAIMLLASCLLYFRAPDREMFEWRAIKKQVLADKKVYILLFASVAILAVLQVAGVHASQNGIMGGDNYGTDFLFHIGIGNSVVYSGFPPKLLYAGGATNVYPFITDFYTSILMYGGFGPVSSLYATNMPLWFSMVAAAIYFISILTKRKYMPFVAFWLFLLCSLWLNMVLIYIFHISLPFLSYQQAQQAAQHGITSLLTYSIMNFSDPLTNNFAPQHDYLVGFPYTLAILSVLYLLFYDGKAKGVSDKRAGTVVALAFCGALAGLMPLIHPFSLVFVFIFSLVGFAYSIWKNGMPARLMGTWLAYGACAVAFAALPLYYMHTGNLSGQFFGSILTFSPWYVSGAGIPQLVLLHVELWAETLGSILILGLMGLIFFRKRLVLFLPAFLALILVNLVRLSPNFGDSNKIVLYFVLFMAVSAAELMAWIIGKGKSSTPRMALAAVLVLALFLVVTFSGMLAEYYDLTGFYPIASRLELNASSWIMNSTPANSIFLDNCYRIQFGMVSSLASRQTVIEDRDYVAMVGLSTYNPYQVDQQIADFLQSPSCQLVRQYNVSYVALMSLPNFAPSWCAPSNYSAFEASSNFTKVKELSDPTYGGNITIFSTNCR